MKIIFWQIFNILLVVALIIFIGIVLKNYFLRK